MDKENTKMKPINNESEKSIEDSLLAEEGDILIWANNNLNEKTVFINIGNATISMPENIFYTLTKLTQQVAKTLLNID